MIEDILKITNLHKDRVQNIYIFGSVVYGNNSEKSDTDILVISKTSFIEREFKDTDLNIHVMTMDKFLDGLNQHNIRNIECLMGPDWSRIQERVVIPFKLDLNKLRHSVSHTNSNSWIKSKKKIQQGDYYIGLKSLYHSIRIVMFGIQIAKYSHIVDFTVANYIWIEMNERIFTWDELDIKYRDINNRLLSEFRLFVKT
jgi:predicted nucleotidyltransferase